MKQHRIFTVFILFFCFVQQLSAMKHHAVGTSEPAARSPFFYNAPAGSPNAASVASEGRVASPFEDEVHGWRCVSTSPFFPKDVPFVYLDFSHQKTYFDTTDKKAASLQSIRDQILILQESGQMVSLNLSDNDLYILPEDFFDEIQNIVYLDISHNRLLRIPETIIFLRDALQYLNVSYNELSYIDVISRRVRRFSSLFGLHNLRWLDASHNMLDIVFLCPDGVPFLHRIDFSHNKIFAQSEDLSALISRGSSINLEGNRFKEGCLL